MNTKKLYKYLPVLFAFILVHTNAISQIKQAKINYKSFTVNAVQKRVSIDWATDNKVPTNYFEIQRSMDDINFKTIDLVLGPDPKQKDCDCYGSFDRLVTTTKKYFYRLKHVNTDGEIQLSETRMLAVNK
ncbi:MAG: hypothetical protein ABI472_13605 [Ginsengibacter sp.]